MQNDSGTLSSPATAQGDPAGFRLLVRSIGMADLALVPVLRRLRGSSDAELASLLYRAPAELVSGLTHQAGTQLLDVLQQTGVELELMPASEQFEPGQGNYEVSLAIKKFDQMAAVIDATARLVGLDTQTAKRVVCATPALLIGHVSLATVDALRRRYAPLGVEVDCSITSQARFDLFTESHDPRTRQLVQQLLAEAGSRSDVRDAQLVACDLDGRVAKRIWDELSRRSERAQMVNRDLHRCDVIVERAPASEGMLSYLVNSFGMPARTAERVVQQTPFVLAENVSLGATSEILAQIEAHGGKAAGVLLAQRRYGLNVGPGGDRQLAKVWIETIAGREALPGGCPDSVRLPGPLTKTQARWLQYELKAIGVPSQLVER